MSFRNLKAKDASHYPSLSEIVKLPSSRELIKSLRLAEQHEPEDSTEANTTACDLSESSSCSNEREDEDDHVVEVTQQASGAEDSDADDDKTETTTTTMLMNMQLRGSEETREAWRKGECNMNAFCFLCNIRLACIMDCDAVVCPVCMCISPVERSYNNNNNNTANSKHVGGVGLGIQLDG